MKGFRALTAVIKTGTKAETVELEWNHLGSSFHRLDKGDPRWVSERKEFLVPYLMFKMPSS